MLCEILFEIHGPNLKVRPVYKLCDFCLAALSVTEAHTEGNIWTSPELEVSQVS